MAEIYEVLDSESDFDEKFNLMLDKTLDELGGYKQAKKLPRDIIKDIEIEWSREGHVYYWVNFKEWLLGRPKDSKKPKELESPMKNTFGDYVLGEDFINIILIPYLKNHYSINPDKQIKLKSVDIQKLTIDSVKKKCIVLEKTDSDRSWITSENLVETIKKFLRYYYECRGCRNYFGNKLTVLRSDMVQLKCFCCSSTINLDIYK